MEALENTYAIILAGGSGTRFWPLSRDSMPKQLLKLFGDTSLLRQTVDRLQGLLPPENIMVLTNESVRDAVIADLPGLPVENIVCEPIKRDTAPAVALAIGWVAARNSEASMMILPADHLVKDLDAFHNDLRQADIAARETDALVTIGIRPTWACPGYGYIERGARAHVPCMEQGQIFEVKRFREKPSTDLAEEFLKNGGYTWNAGMFFWTIGAVLRELSRHCPELVDFISNLRKAPDFASTVRAQFPNLPASSIDYALMEKASRVLNLEATFDWDDVGGWKSAAQYFPADDHDNRSNTELTGIHAHENVVFSQTGGRHVALLGVSNLIVVETADAILVADAGMADSIKQIVTRIPKELR